MLLLEGRRVTSPPKLLPPFTVEPVRTAPPPPRPHRLKPLLALLVVLVLIVLVTRWQRVKPGPAGGPQAVATVEARTGTLEQTLALSGKTAARLGASLRAPQLGGRRTAGTSGFELVLQTLALAGTRVAKGEVVASFDPLAMVNRLDDAVAERVDRQGTLKTTKAGAEVELAAQEQKIRGVKARMDKAALDLQTVAVRSAIQAELYRLAWEQARAEYQALQQETRYLEQSQAALIRAAELALQEAQVEERRAAANVGRMVARAPMEGLVVISDTFRGGELSPIRAGEQLGAGQMFMQIADPRSLIIEAYANQADSHLLRIGQAARVRFDAFPDLSLPAHITAIGALAESTSRTDQPWVRQIRVRLDLGAIDPRLIPDLSANVTVILHAEPGQIIIPRQAVFTDDATGRPYAWVLQARGWERRELELGPANNVEASVRSGLAVGESAALSPPPVKPAGNPE